MDYDAAVSGGLGGEYRRIRDIINLSIILTPSLTPKLEISSIFGVLLRELIFLAGLFGF